jgi:predicted metal-dependent hydrolase
MTETLRIGELNFEVRRSPRRRTLGLTVDRRGELVVYAPEMIADATLARWVAKKLLWVHRKLALKEDSTPKMRSPQFVSGEAFCYLGRRFRLKVVGQADEPLRFAVRQFVLRSDARPAEEHFRRWYAQNGSEWLRRRVQRLSHYVPKKPKRVEVRDLGFRWGSCGKNDVLFFNWKVLQLPVQLIDYVIMHELVHLSERHHGFAFWKALARALPDCEDRKRRLAAKAKDYLVFGLSA